MAYKIPFEKFLVFNEGKEYTPFDKKQGEDLIPAVIHQAWLGGELPPVKAYFFNKTARLYPNYQMKLWTLKDITKEAFPRTHGIIKTLCEFNHLSPYNKFATMTDLLRH
jgi:mannosyltransferase OCH1-like enzyme